MPTSNFEALYIILVCRGMFYNCLFSTEFLNANINFVFSESLAATINVYWSNTMMWVA